MVFRTLSIGRPEMLLHGGKCLHAFQGPRGKAASGLAWIGALAIWRMGLAAQLIFVIVSRAAVLTILRRSSWWRA